MDNPYTMRRRPDLELEDLFWLLSFPSQLDSEPGLERMDVLCEIAVIFTEKQDDRAQKYLRNLVNDSDADPDERCFACFTLLFNMAFLDEESCRAVREFQKDPELSKKLWDSMSVFSKSLDEASNGGENA